MGTPTAANASEPVTIASFLVEDVARVKAVRMAPLQTGLTIIGGNNDQGKTTILNSIAWTLGGAKFAPSSARRDGALGDPKTDIVLSNGLRVGRKGKNSSLYVTDPTGARGTQGTLDAFISTFALDLPKFLNASDRDKADILLNILGIGAELKTLETQEKQLYDKRHAIGQIADSKAKHAEELPEFADAPTEPISVSELIRQQQDILARNGQKAALRNRVTSLSDALANADRRVADLTEQLARATVERDKLQSDLQSASKSAQDLHDESTLEIESNIENIERINAWVAANEQKARARDEALGYRAQYDGLTCEIEQVRAARMALLDGANLPMPGLSVVDGVLQYNGKAWDCMSGSEQLRVAVAVVRRLNQSCGFALLDKLEQFDMQTLREFAQWCQSEKLQVISTRVSTGNECTIVIEDGLEVGKTYAETVSEIEPPKTGEPLEW